MSGKKVRNKYVSFSAQREQCRLNKYTYIETCECCDRKTLMCNYPFSNPEHKKGVCRASTCTDMRTIPAEIVEADMSQSKEEVEAAKKAGYYDTDEASKKLSNTIDEEVLEEACDDATQGPKPEDIAKSA